MSGQGPGRNSNKHGQARVSNKRPAKSLTPSPNVVPFAEPPPPEKPEPIAPALRVSKLGNSPMVEGTSEFACVGTGRQWVDPMKRAHHGVTGWGKCPVCHVGGWDMGITRPTPRVVPHVHDGPIIVVDTREQMPYETIGPDNSEGFLWPLVRGKLDAGDYSILGHETKIAIERKRPIELYSCFSTDRDRFRREFAKLATYDYAAMVIEGTMPSCSVYTDIHGRPYPNLWHKEYTEVSPAFVMNSITSWSIRFGVPVWFAGGGMSADDDRSLAQALTFSIFDKYWKLVCREEPPRYGPR